MMLLRVFLVISFWLPLSADLAAQGTRRINPIHIPRRNPNITEPSLNPPMSDNPMPPAARFQVPVGLVHVHQTVDLPQGDAALMTLDGEPLPAATVKNVTLGMVVSGDGLIVARLVGVLPSQPPRDLKVYAADNGGRPLTAQFLGMDAV
ncbi:MAG: hypothetical protein HOP19_13675, partial [Acidobacteria bacterium]|nr:hypothetical protein [Acidobacteriota bacterium]